MNNTTAEKKHLVPHPLYQDYTFTKYCEKIPQFYFKKEVPADVVKNFEVVEKLMVFSYYEYRFVDEAYAKALTTFEMAMNLRYKDFFPTSKDLMFNDLIHELTKLNLFDLDIESLKHLKWTRNQFAHPTHHTFAGIIFWNRIEFVSRTINEMYEDVDLRLVRNKLLSDFYAKQKETNLCESLVITKGNDKMNLFRLKLLFINNKETPSTYTFLCVPLFEITDDEEKGAPVPQIFNLQIFDPKIENSVLTAQEYLTNEPIKISSVFSDSVSAKEYNEWKEKFDLVKRKFLYESGINFHTPELVIPEIQRFQEM